MCNEKEPDLGKEEKDSARAVQKQNGNQDKKEKIKVKAKAKVTAKDIWKEIEQAQKRPKSAQQVEPTIWVTADQTTETMEATTTYR